MALLLLPTIKKGLLLVMSVIVPYLIGSVADFIAAAVH